ncbi:MAG: hypothetical protein RI958_2831 [Actinomycetota bacterium]
MSLTRADAEALDASDPLARWRDEFVVGDPTLVYLDGNSLGRAPRRTIERMRAVIEQEWAADLIRSWEHWVELPQRVGDELAPVIGALPGEVVVHDSTSVNLYQLVHAACALRPDRSVLAVDTGDFPSDRYVVDGVAEATGRRVRSTTDRLDDVAVVVRSAVDYRTAEAVDLAAETARIHAAGALVVWDLSHAAGVLKVDLRRAGVQLAVGCTYKFLNGGPGSPGFSYVASELVGQVRQPIWGWFGQHDQFAMGPRYQPRPDIGRLLIGTPSILALTSARAGISLTAEAGIDAIAHKASALTGFAIELCDQYGLDTCTPREPTRRGGHVSVVHPDARRLVAALTQRNVVPDFREPDIVRLGLAPLGTSFVDVYDGLGALAELVGG